MLSSYIVKPLAGLLLLTSLAGCQALSVPPLPKSPAQTVYELKTAEAAALIIAVKYKSLPPCPTVPICSDPKVISKIQSIDQTARIAIDTAENFSRGDFTAADISNAVQLASRAVTALTGVTSSLKVQ